MSYYIVLFNSNSIYLKFVKDDPERCCGEGGGRGVHVWERM